MSTTIVHDVPNNYKSAPQHPCETLDFRRLMKNYNNQQKIQQQLRLLEELALLIQLPDSSGGLKMIFGYNLGKFCVWLQIFHSTYKKQPYDQFDALMSYSLRDAYWTMKSPLLTSDVSLVNHGFALGYVKETCHFKEATDLDSDLIWWNQIGMAMYIKDTYAMKLFLKNFFKLGVKNLHIFSIKSVFGDSEKISWNEVHGKIVRGNELLSSFLTTFSAL